MNTKHQIDNNLFVLENVFDNSTILDTAIKECIDNENKGEFLARFSIKNLKTNEELDFNKNFIDLSSSEKFLFNNSDFFNRDVIDVLRKDIDVNPSMNTKELITTTIISAVSEIYPELEGELTFQYDSVIKYSNGYKMSSHRDAGSDRICTAVLYLNSKLENDKGGDVIFYDDDDITKEILKYEPVKNDLIIFDSYYNDDTLEHSVTEIINWDRYVYRVYVIKK